MFFAVMLWAHYAAVGVATIIAGAVLLSAIVFLIVYNLVDRFAGAIRHITRRMLAASHGDFLTPLPAQVHAVMPELSGALEKLFRKTYDNIENVQTLAMVDSLTGLANRVSFCRQVDRWLAEAEGTNRIGAMIFIDLDGFKTVNDTLGHAAGDHVLTYVAGRLREVIMHEARDDAGDASLGRFAGDEFTLFLPDIADVETAMRVGRAIQYTLDGPFDVGGAQAKIGASVGISSYPAHGMTLTALLRSADQAMYDAKHGGRGQVRLYSEELEKRLSGRAQREQELRQAIERNEFLLRFQPQVDIVTRHVVCAEALVRWDHPFREGLVTPDGFVSLAEETGLIVELGDWVMNEVCLTARRWAAMGVKQRISMNISARELMQPDFFDRFHAAMIRHDVPPGRLELELSETLMMSLRPDIVEKLAQVRTGGVTIAVDDFGTGFSNLPRLRGLPIDVVKIDRKVVRDIAVSTEARTICAAIIGLVKGLELPIVAEGVEKTEQIALLQAMGCNVFQGYALSRPIRERAYLARFSDMPAAYVQA
ncbi:MAG: EAL domain-containing protein [Sphingobium sp.]|nr:EAL domain-containing protein [Sphingobium sp.]